VNGLTKGAHDRLVQAALRDGGCSHHPEAMHGECCASVQPRHTVADSTLFCRAHRLAWLTALGFNAAWFWHPILHNVLRWFGLPCP
jgi:hypothetical protein